MSIELGNVCLSSVNCKYMLCESILNKEELRQSMVAKFSSGKLEKKKLTSNEYRFLNSISILGVEIKNESSLSNNCYMFMFSCLY